MSSESQSDQSPPRSVLRLLSWFCPEQLYEEIEGDLIQKFNRDVKLIGKQRAKRRLIWNTLRFFRPGIILRNKVTMHLTRPDMIRNDMKVALRNMKRHSLHAAINVLSLTIGLAACILVFLFIRDERSFDLFHRKAANIFRLNELQKISNGSFQKVALTGSPFGPGMLAEFPEIKNYTRVESLGTRLLSRGDKRILTQHAIVSVDSSFLTIFDFDLSYGDRKTAFDLPNSIVLTEKTALLFFPIASDALGQSIILGDDKTEFKITGVFRNLPQNSHIQFDAATSLATYIQHHPEFETDWTGNFLSTYFLLHENADLKKMEARFPEWLIRWTEYPEINKGFGIYLQPLSEVHLNSVDIEHDYINHRKFNGKYLTIFLITGLFVLLIASVNFMNLTTARAAYRWREIGVRKTIGARKRQLFTQFICESVLLSLIALIIAITIDSLFLPLLNQWIGRQLSLWPMLLDVRQLLPLIALAIFLGVSAALYPSVYMSSANLIQSLKGTQKRNGKSVFQNTLVVFQFGLALAFMISTMIVMQQLSYMRKSDLGFNKDGIMLVSLNRESNAKFDLLKSELLKNKYVTGVTASGQRIGNNLHQTGFNVKANNELKNAFTSHLNVDYDYLGVYGIQIAEGRTFSKNFKTDKGKAYLINKSMADELDLKKPIGMLAGFNSDSLGTIIGVVDNFKYNSLHHKVSSLFIVCNPTWGYDELSIKMNDRADLTESISSIKGVWDKVIPDFPFTYSFLDDHIETLYHDDQQFSSVVAIMTVLAILISCMGLFGLAATITERKTKEIGIRKILGANEMQIVILLSRNLALLILASFAIASPITYKLLSVWLQNFAYRIDIDLTLFAAGIVMALAIALLTISYHTIKTARSNPVNNLRSE